MKNGWPGFRRGGGEKNGKRMSTFERETQSTGQVLKGKPGNATIK